MERSLRFEGENDTVVLTEGDGSGGGGTEEDKGFDSGIGADDGSLDLGAKNREMTCCFCLPILFFGRSTDHQNKK